MINNGHWCRNLENTIGKVPTIILHFGLYWWKCQARTYIWPIAGNILFFYCFSCSYIKFIQLYGGIWQEAEKASSEWHSENSLSFINYTKTGTSQLIYYFLYTYFNIFIFQDLFSENLKEESRIEVVLFIEQNVRYILQFWYGYYNTYLIVAICNNFVVSLW